MKLLRFVMFILYQYYSKGRYRGAAYFDALILVSLMIMMHLFQLLIVIDKMRPFPTAEVLFVLLPAILVVFLLAPPAEIKKLHYSVKEVRMGGIWLIVYGVLSFTFFIVLAFLFRK
ncbi:hypothetical protein ACQKLP_10185 [Chitinophaga sp. NPDC101104]|uniref:hypothetical protein n=1 Tax=Chitinophaga sp. NPDC101104 TaxID=3390561 RepID=UPI003D09211B